MRPDKKLWLIVALVLTLLLITSPPTFGAHELAANVVSYSASGSIVSVKVTNPSPVPVTGAVFVQATTAAGSTASAASEFSLAPGQTKTVRVSMAATITQVVVCGATTDGPSPI